MPAFLSHSSIDKAFVRAVAEGLSRLEVELDEFTFEYTMNVQAIRQALRRSDLVVFFVSKASVQSSFVAEEQRQTLEAMGRGTVKKVLIFAIDNTSYRALPEWLREINVAQQISSPQLCSRRIEANLAELAVIDEPDTLYLGRDEDEKRIRRALRAARSETPTTIHMAGFYGVGRRTFIKNTMKKLQPGQYLTFPEIAVNRYSSISDIYRSIYRMIHFSSLRDQVDDFTAFENLDYLNQSKRVGDLIKAIANNREMLIVYDEGNGVFSDDGSLYEHWLAITRHIEDFGRPLLTFIQTQSQPMRHRLGNTRSFHQRLEELGREATKELISFSLKDKGVDFTELELDQITELSGGHPFNIRVAVSLAESYKVQPFLANPGVFISWRDRRGEEFLAQIAFNEVESEVMAILVDYRLAATEALISIVNGDRRKTVDALQTLQDFFCVEFRDGVFSVASPIREAARRDERFIRLPDWHREVAQTIVKLVSDFTTDDDVPVTLLETAAMAAVRTDEAPEYIRALVLPSHLLTMAREHYDQGRRRQCIEMSKQAYEYKRSMTLDAQVEALHIWALSAARIPDETEYNSATERLSNIGTPLSVRTLAFVRAFQARMKGRDDDARKLYKEAWELAPLNGSINRELAKLYCNHRRYTDAEGYARQAYNTSPTNPYVLDVMVEVLEGKQGLGLPVNHNELQEAHDKLRQYGSQRGFSFHFVREAQRMLNERNYNRAIELADAAIENTPKLHAPYFIKLDAQLRQPGNVESAEKTLSTIKAMIAETGITEGASSSIAESEIQILIEKKQYSSAKSATESDRRLPSRVRMRILSNLARAISFEPDMVPGQIKEWARSYRH